MLIYKVVKQSNLKNILNKKQRMRQKLILKRLEKKTNLQDDPIYSDSAISKIVDLKDDELDELYSGLLYRSTMHR